MKILKLLLLAALGFVLGYGMILLLPGIYMTWLTSWAQTPADLPHRCAGDAAADDFALAEGRIDTYLESLLR